MSRWMNAVLGMSLIFGACGDSDTQEEVVVIVNNSTTNNTSTNNTSANNTSTNNTSMNNTSANNTAGSPADLLGTGEASSVDFKQIHTTTQGLEATAIAFNPAAPEQLWVTQRRPATEAPCTNLLQTAEGCGALEGVNTIIFNPGEANQRADVLVDGNAWHFMRRPSSMAFGAENTFATCHEERTGNFLDDVANFIGPTLWSSDLSVFAQDPGPGLNGSHLDMLHQTPYCMGIAHEQGNVYWTFNGLAGALDRYDFAADHGPGWDDHSDGEVQRYAVGQFKRVEGVPSHMVVVDGWVYTADTGNRRIVRFNPEGATVSGAIAPTYEPLAVNEILTGGTLTDVITFGATSLPSGLVHHDGMLFTSDNASGKILAVSLEGEIVRELQTPLGAGALSALAIGPDNKLYFADLTNASVWRIDPK